jgi:hypothetical protein
MLYRYGSPDGAAYLVLQDLLKGKQVSRFKLGFGAGPTLHNNPMDSLVFAPDGKALVVLVYEPTIYALDLATGRELRCFRGHTKPPNAVAISPDGGVLVSCGGRIDNPYKPAVDMSLRFWDFRSGQQLHVDKSVGMVTSVAFSPDGKLLATAAKWERATRVREVFSGKEIFSFRDDNPTYPRHVTFSPKGDLLASCLSDDNVLVWDVAPWKPKQMAVRLTTERIEKLWNSLGTADARRAYRTVLVLAAAPELSVPFLKTRLKALAGPSPKILRQLVANLEGKEFRTRQRATDDLMRLGRRAEPLLRKVAVDSASAEARARARQLLNRLGPAPPWFVRDPDVLRVLRGIWILQRCGTSEAKVVLEHLATGDETERQTGEAQAALRILDGARQGSGKQ